MVDSGIVGGVVLVVLVFGLGSGGLGLCVYF